MKYDVVIIGAGLGGLTAGAKLAREGKRVLVIEQHTQPGGCATTFKRGDYTLEVGLHEMDGPSPKDIKTRIFNDLGVSGHVSFLQIPEFYRFINGRCAVTVPHDPVKAAEELTAYFPDEAEGIKTYFGRILSPPKKTADGDNTDISVGDFLDSIISNEDLKLVLLGNLGYFHDDPYSLSLDYYSLAQGSYYRNGASYIRGGSQKLPDYLAEYIRSHGGETLTGHLVTEVMVEDGIATGLKYKRKHSPEIFEVFADEIIANNAVPNLSGMVQGSTGEEMEKDFSGLKAGASLLTLYLGFNRPPSELGNRYYSTCVFDGSIKTQRDIHRNNNDDFSRRSFIFVDYSQLDSALAPEGKGVGAVCCVDYIENWAGLSRKEYLEKKEKVASELIARLEMIIPGIKETIAYHDIGTPATIRRYTLNPGGAVYGFAQTPSRRAFERFSSVENLHIASAWGKTGGGFSGAICGGYFCAFNILRKRPKQ